MKWAVFDATSSATQEVELTPARDSPHLLALDLTPEMVERYFYARAAWDEVNVQLRGLQAEAESQLEMKTSQLTPIYCEMMPTEKKKKK